MRACKFYNAGVSEYLGKQVSVLDHGSVTLVDVWGDDLTAVDAARVSFDGSSEGRTEEQNKKLIGYLMKHQHHKPWEHTSMSFIIECPIQVARQFATHRISSVSEISGRYVELEEEVYLPTAEDINQQSSNNKQGRGEVLSGDEAGHVRGILADANGYSFDSYRKLLDTGVAKEIARGVLPLNTYTKFRWTINLRSLFNFLKLRLDRHAQLEIRRFSAVIYDMFKAAFPWTAEAFDEHVLNAVTLSKSEAALLVERLDELEYETIPSEDVRKVYAKVGFVWEQL